MHRCVFPIMVILCGTGCGSYNVIDSRIKDAIGYYGEMTFTRNGAGPHLSLRVRGMSGEGTADVWGLATQTACDANLVRFVSQVEWNIVDSAPERVRLRGGMVLLVESFDFTYLDASSSPVDLSGSEVHLCLSLSLNVPMGKLALKGEVQYSLVDDSVDEGYGTKTLELRYGTSSNSEIVLGYTDTELRSSSPKKFPTGTSGSQMLNIHLSGVYAGMALKF